MLVHLEYTEPTRKAGLGETKPCWWGSYSDHQVRTRTVIRKLGHRLAKEGLVKAGKPVDTMKFVAWIMLNHSMYDYCLTPAMKTFMGAAWFEQWSVHEDKVENREWTQPVWVDTPWFQNSPYRVLHYLHGSTKIEGNVAYAESVEKAQADRYITTKPGRYLAKFFGDVLSEREIKEWADKQVAASKPAVVRWADTEEDMIRAINKGPSDSCMSAGFRSGRGDGESWFNGHVHPAAIYATPDITIAYLEDHDGKIVARAICNKNTQKVARCYGDARRLVPALEALGWEQRAGALEGCRVRKIVNRKGSRYGDTSYIMAYVDAGIGSGGGSLGYKDAGDGEHWVLTESHRDGNTYEGFDHDGVTSNEAECTCEMCGEGMDEDDSYHIESTEQTVCEHCRDRNFVYAMGRRYEDWHPTDDCIEVDGSWYVSEYASNHDIGECEVRNEWYHMDDLVFTSHGMVHNEEAVSLDVADDDGHEYATPDYTETTHDGRVIHSSNAMKIEIGGVVYVCHDEDDVEALTQEKEEA